MKRLLSYTELAELTGIPRGTLSRWVSEGKVPHLRFGTRSVRFDPDEIERWLDEHRVGGGR